MFNIFNQRPFLREEEKLVCLLTLRFLFISSVSLISYSFFLLSLDHPISKRFPPTPSFVFSFLNQKWYLPKTVISYPAHLKAFVFQFSKSQCSYIPDYKPVFGLFLFSVGLHFSEDNFICCISHLAPESHPLFFMTSTVSTQLSTKKYMLQNKVKCFYVFIYIYTSI